MGAPSIDISFIEKGISAIKRGERGIVMLWVKDTLPAPAINPVTVVTENDIPADLSDATVEQVKLAMIGFDKGGTHKDCNDNRDAFFLDRT